TGETRLRFWALAGQPPAVVPTNRKQAVPRSRNRGTNYPRSAFSVYGIRKMWHAMNREGFHIGRDKTARLMKLAGVSGRRRGRT
ncbi:IS3 family transposase, partial [Corynebacterium striatum]